MTIGASVVRKAGEHQAETVQKLRSRAECAADSRDRRTLVKSEGSGNIENFVHICFCSLGHPPSSICGQSVQVSSGTFGIQNPQSERGFPRAGYPGDSDDPAERDIYINIFQVVDSCASN